MGVFVSIAGQANELSWRGFTLRAIKVNKYKKCLIEALQASNKKTRLTT
jgi:hypothetical protein